MTAIDYQVAASGDDGHWYQSTFSGNGVSLQIGGTTSRDYNIFARFTGVTIPAGATITAAYVSLHYTGAAGTPGEFPIYFEDAANPAAPTTAADANGRTKTTATINWTPPGSANWNNSPDLSSIIQELVNSYDYSSGAAMQFLWIGAIQETTIFRQYKSYDYTGNESGPKLHIEYTEAAGGYAHSQCIII